MPLRKVGIHPLQFLDDFFKNFKPNIKMYRQKTLSYLFDVLNNMNPSYLGTCVGFHDILGHTCLAAISNL